MGAPLQPHQRKIVMLVVVILVVVGLAYIAFPQGAYEIKYRGRTMGTTWSVKIHSDQKYDPEIANAIQSELDFVEHLMSNWREESDVSRFNRSEINSCTSANVVTLAVVVTSQRISDLSDGAFDVTIGPVIDLWGFGSKFNKQNIPEQEDVDEALARTGLQSMYVTDDQICKRDKNVELNVSGIAKGYAVDRVAMKLDSLKLNNYLVEVGGELKAQGLNGRGTYWTVGVEQPNHDLLAAGYRTAVPLVNTAIATSGDYRNFFEVSGSKYSHIIDPTTGYPVTHNLASVTVLASSSMEADAWATALLVLGPEKGMEIAKLQSLAVLMIVRKDEGFEIQASENWPKS